MRSPPASSPDACDWVVSRREPVSETDRRHSTAIRLVGVTGELAQHSTYLGEQEGVHEQVGLLDVLGDVGVLVQPVHLRGCVDGQRPQELHVRVVVRQVRHLRKTRGARRKVLLARRHARSALSFVINLIVKLRSTADPVVAALGAGGLEIKSISELPGWFDRSCNAPLRSALR
eukprot:8492813-Pyramimonas_sp.AAC.2